MATTAALPATSSPHNPGSAALSSKYTAIGNGTYAALLNGRGRYVWCCLGSFGGDPIFNSLANNDSDETGFFDVVLEGDVLSTEQSYVVPPTPPYCVALTNLVVTRITSTSGVMEIVDFAPKFSHFDRLFRPFQLFRIIRKISGDPCIRIRIRPTFGYNSTDGYRTRGSHHIRYCGPTVTWRVTTTISVQHIIDETPFLLTGNASEPEVIVFGQDESFASSLRTVAREFQEKTAMYWRGWSLNLSLPVFVGEVGASLVGSGGRGGGSSGSGAARPSGGAAVGRIDEESRGGEAAASAASGKSGAGPKSGSGGSPSSVSPVVGTGAAVASSDRVGSSQTAADVLEDHIRNSNSRTQKRSHFYQTLLIRAAIHLIQQQCEENGGLLSCLTMGHPLTKAQHVFRDDMPGRTTSSSTNSASPGAGSSSTSKILASNILWRDARVCRLLDECMSIRVLREMGLFDVCRKFLEFLKNVVLVRGVVPSGEENGRKTVENGIFPEEDERGSKNGNGSGAEYGSRETETKGHYQHSYGALGEREIPLERMPYLAGYQGSGLIAAGGITPGEANHRMMFALLVIALAHAFFDVRLEYLCSPRLFEILEQLALKAYQSFQSQVTAYEKVGAMSMAGSRSSRSSSRDSATGAASGYFDDDVGFYNSSGVTSKHRSASAATGSSEPRGPYTFEMVLYWAAADRVSKVAAVTGGGQGQGGGAAPNRSRKWKKMADEMRRKIEALAWRTTSEGGYFTSFFGGKEVGPALLRLVEVGFLDEKDERFRKTLVAFEEDANLAAISPNTFTVSTLMWYAEALRVAGRRSQALSLVDAVGKVFESFGSLPEAVDLGESRAYGNFPCTAAMLAFMRVVGRLDHAGDGVQSGAEVGGGGRGRGPAV